MPPKAAGAKRKLSYQPHKLSAAQRRQLEADYNAKAESLSAELATLQAENIRLKNRGMLLERQLAMQDEKLHEACRTVQVRDVDTRALHNLIDLDV